MLRVACLGVLLASPAARAAPIVDPEAWTQSFVRAAGQGDSDTMAALIEGAAAPGFDVSALTTAIRTTVKPLTPSRIEHAEAFDGADVGSFYKRVNVAVVSKTGYYFYGFVLGRGTGGWVIYGFKADADVNKILGERWPS